MRTLKADDLLLFEGIGGGYCVSDGCGGYECWIIRDINYDQNAPAVLKDPLLRAALVARFQEWKKAHPKEHTMRV